MNLNILPRFGKSPLLRKVFSYISSAVFRSIGTVCQFFAETCRYEHNKAICQVGTDRRLVPDCLKFVFNSRKLQWTQLNTGPSTRSPAHHVSKRHQSLTYLLKLPLSFCNKELQQASVACDDLNNELPPTRNLTVASADMILLTNVAGRLPMDCC